VNRRDFIKSSLYVALAGATVATTACSLFENKEQRLKRLLSQVYQPSFAQYMQGQSYENLLGKLEGLGVIDQQGNILAEIVASLVEQSDLQVHENFYYSEVEMDIYTLAAFSAKKAS